MTLTEKHLLLRGSVMRATHHCLGIVVYTGRESKLSLNNHSSAPSKLSSIDRVVNRTLMVAIGAMILVCLISMGLNVMWTNKNEDADYLCLHKDDLNDQYTSDTGKMLMSDVTMMMKL